jgi:hypothetical protein
MFSPIKIALFALISFATLAVAIPAPEPRHADAKALITDCNYRLQSVILPIGTSACLSFPLTQVYAHGLRIAYVNSDNATSEYVSPVLDEVVVILTDLVDGLQGSGLSGCGCTSQDILGLISTTLQVLLPSLSVVFPLTLTFHRTDHPWTAWPCMRFIL